MFKKNQNIVFPYLNDSSDCTKSLKRIEILSLNCVCTQPVIKDFMHSYKKFGHSMLHVTNTITNLVKLGAV